MSNIVPFNPEEAAAILERLLIQGDLSQLTHQQRAEYYIRVCVSVGLNPYTQPFEYIRFKDGKLKLYAVKGCTDQLRRLHSISLAELSRTEEKGIFIVTARAVTPDGRTDQDIGAVSIDKLSGEALANAMMKAATKAKRRATLAICGLGLLDETEADSIPGAVKVTPDWTAIENRSAALPSPAPRPRQRAQTIDNRYEAVIRADRIAARKPPRQTDPLAHFDERNPPPFDYADMR